MHCLICFCNEHTESFRKYDKIRIQKKHNKTNLTMSFSCLRCITVSPTLSPDKTKDNLLSQVYGACCDLASRSNRTLVLRHSGRVRASSAQAALSTWRTSLHCSPGESHVLPPGPNQIQFLFETSPGSSVRGIAPLSRGQRIIFFFYFSTFYKLPCHMVSGGHWYAGSGFHLLSRPDSATSSTDVTLVP